MTSNKSLTKTGEIKEHGNQNNKLENSKRFEIGRIKKQKEEQKWKFKEIPCKKQGKLLEQRKRTEENKNSLRKTGRIAWGKEEKQG